MMFDMKAESNTLDALERSADSGARSQTPFFTSLSSSGFRLPLPTDPDHEIQAVAHVAVSRLLNC